MLRTLLLTFCSTALFSQNFIAFPDSNARWVNTIEEQTGVVTRIYAPEYFITNQDTLIAGKRYVQLFELYHNRILYRGAYRNDSARLFFIPQGSTQASLMYDFNVQVGDTINSWKEFHGGQVYPWGGLGSKVVDEIDTISTSLGLRRIIHADDTRFFEGVGSETGFLEGPCPCISGYYYVLSCFSVSDSIYWEQGNLHSQPISGNCAAYFSMEEWPETAVELFPNPSQGTLNLKVAERGTLQVFSSQGLLLETHPISGQTQLDLHHLPKGSYWLKLLGNSYPWLKQ